MENQKKIVGFLVVILFLTSCSNEPIRKKDKSNVDNENLSFSAERYLGRIKNKDSNLIFEVRSIVTPDSKVNGYFFIENNVAQFTHLINPYGDTLKVHETIDSLTFRVVGLSNEEKRKIRNPYFFDGRMRYYYYDNMNFYAYLDQDSPQFLLLGKKSEAELLGGHFVRVKNQIFVQGVRIDSADVSTFHTIDIFWTEKTEWSRTIGLDNEHIYISEKILTKEGFDKLIANDSLKHIYFPE